MLQSTDRHQAVCTKRSANNIGTALRLVMSSVKMDWWWTIDGNMLS